MIKQSGGLLTPAYDIDSEAMTKFKTGEVYEVEIKRGRNPKHHRLMFAFLHFCFEHWQSDREFVDEAGQFEVFRQNLTVLAGYHDTHYTITGNVRVVAKSLSYASMTQDEFEACYKAMIAAALRTIFKGCGRDVESRLLSFF